jgi:hypothetical protein
VLDDGVTGFIVTTLDEAAAAVARLDGLDRAKVRARFEQRFTAERMMQDYVEIYRSLPGVGKAGRLSPRGDREDNREDLTLQPAN